jgi:hypothetical protein
MAARGKLLRSRDAHVLTLSLVFALCGATRRAGAGLALLFLLEHAVIAASARLSLGGVSFDAWCIVSHTSFAVVGIG